MGEEEHKIALFTDDVMMYLRDPAISARYSWYFIRIQTKCARKKKEKKKRSFATILFHQKKKGQNIALIIM